MKCCVESTFSLTINADWSDFLFEKKYDIGIQIYSMLTGEATRNPKAALTFPSAFLLNIGKL